MHSSSTLLGLRLAFTHFLIASHSSPCFHTVLLPFHSINAGKAVHQFDSVVNQNKLTVVSVENPTTVFKDGKITFTWLWL